jgi:Skp family chaperone for outer membrane proteins
VLDKAQQAIVEVGKAGGYAYVLDSSQSKGVVIFLDGGHDLMKDVKTKLGIQ